MTPSDVLADPQYYTFLEALAKQAARTIGRKFRTPVEDLTQEALTWCLTHPGKFMEYWGDDNRRRGERYITAAMKNACKDYAVQEQALTGGSDGKTQFWYRGKLLESLLGHAWDEEATTNVEILDVRRALEKLSEYDQWLLKSYYFEDLLQADIASLHADHISQPSVSRRLQRALGRVHAELGGRRPHTDPPEPGWQDYVGSRKVLSNAQAAAITGSQYAGE